MTTRRSTQILRIDGWAVIALMTAITLVLVAAAPAFAKGGKAGGGTRSIGRSTSLPGSVGSKPSATRPSRSTSSSKPKATSGRSTERRGAGSSTSMPRSGGSSRPSARPATPRTTSPRPASSGRRSIGSSSSRRPVGYSTTMPGRGGSTASPSRPSRPTYTQPRRVTEPTPRPQSPRPTVTERRSAPRATSPQPRGGFQIDRDRVPAVSGSEARPGRGIGHRRRNRYPTGFLAIRGRHVRGHADCQCSRHARYRCSMGISRRARAETKRSQADHPRAARVDEVHTLSELQRMTAVRILRSFCHDRG